MYSFIQLSPNIYLYGVSLSKSINYYLNMIFVSPSFLNVHFWTGLLSSNTKPHLGYLVTIQNDTMDWWTHA